MEIKKITDKAFQKYGAVIEGMDFSELLAWGKTTPAPDDVIYEPSDKTAEAMKACEDISRQVYGEMPIQIGYCNGKNDTLNAIEYHRCSEINIAYQGAVLIVGCQQDIEDDFTYDTGKMEMFEVPAGCAVELYATTLHYAPCSLVKDGFQVAIVLAKGTNEEAPKVTGALGEDRLLAARNKWLIAHEESGLGEGGAFVGLKGKNLKTGIKF